MSENLFPIKKATLNKVALVFDQYRFIITGKSVNSKMLGKLRFRFLLAIHNLALLND